MKIKKNLLVLAIVLLIAIVLRFWHLGQFPALNADEAALGYNAYSLLETGKDEHGNSWPIHFQSFNDYKPGLYVYMILPFIKFFGLNIWSVRFVGALLGVTTVLLVYLLGNLLFPDKNKEFCGLKFGIWPALMLSVSPWHIHFSRGAWEVNVATFFMVLGVYLFIKAAKKGTFLSFILCLLPFILSLYTYHAARVVAPLLGLLLVITYREEISKNLKPAIKAFILGVGLLLPLAISMARPDAISRAAGVGLFADPGPLSRVNEQRGEHHDYTNIFPKVLHNKLVNYSLAFVQNWGEHFWGEFLFLSGDEIERNRVPETGQMYLQDLAFIIVGLVAVVVLPKRHERKSWQVVVSWLLVAPIAAALTFQSPHALRAHNMVIPLIIISAYGFVIIIDWFKDKPKMLWVTGYLLLGIVITWQFARYLDMYWVHMAAEYPFSSQYGVRELVDFVEENSEDFQKILVTDRYDQPYILFLFYMKYPPKQFQADHVLTSRDSYGFSTVNHFDKFVFTTIRFDEAQPENPNSLIIGTDEEIPEEANIIKDIYGKNGYKYFQIVAN